MGRPAKRKWRMNWHDISRRLAKCSVRKVDHVGETDLYDLDKGVRRGQ